MRRIVALKLMSRSHEIAGAAFRREIAAAARLSHPHVVLPRDAGEVGGRRFLVMDYVEGIDLQSLVERQGPLAVPLALEALRQTALALHCVHEAGLIHNDVKPGNIMLTAPLTLSSPPSDGGEGRVTGATATFKLLDLGLARLTDGGDDRSDTAPEVGRAGTLNYLAPERAAEPDSADARGDLYSLGCTAFYLLTGEVPYPGGGPAQKLLRHIHAEVPSVRDRRSDVPEDLDALVRRLMAKAPADRFATAADLRAALSTATAPGPARLAGPTVGAASRAAPAAPDDRDGGARPIRGRAARWLWCGGVLGTFLAGLSFVLAAPWGRKDASPAPERRPLPFAVEGGGAFPSLAEAVRAAPGGGLITVRGPGPYPMRPLAWQGKALTIRGETGLRPILERRPAAADAPWDALLTTDMPLSLIGLELRHASGKGDAEGGLVCSEGAVLRLADCVVTSRGAHPAVVHRRGSELSVSSCRIEATEAAVAVEVGLPAPCRLHARDNELTARVAFALWAPEVCEGGAVGLELEGNRVVADRLVSCRALPGPLAVRGANNDFLCRDGLFHFTAERRPGDWNRLLTWQARDNRLRGPKAVNVEDKEYSLPQPYPGTAIAGP
jgi:hypothetical protein